LRWCLLLNIDLMCFLWRNILECICFVNFCSINYYAIFNNFSKLIVDKLLIIIDSKDPILIVDALIYGIIDLQSALFKVVDQVIVEFTTLNNERVPAFADLFIENLLLLLVVIWLRLVLLYKLLALLKCLL
jgi:hypothetical protein